MESQRDMVRASLEAEHDHGTYCRRKEQRRKLPGRRDEDAWYPTRVVAEVGPKGGLIPVATHPLATPAPGVSPNRQGWRARLANVERLLVEVDAGFTPGVSEPTWSRATAALIEAVGEVRSMLDGE